MKDGGKIIQGVKDIKSLCQVFLKNEYSKQTNFWYNQL